MAPAWLMWAIAGVCILGFYAFVWSLCRASAHADRAAERHHATTGRRGPAHQWDVASGTCWPGCTGCASGDPSPGPTDEPPAREVTA